MLAGDRWTRARRLLEEVLDQPADSRHQFLADACRDDSGVRREVESLLCAHDAAGTFLEPVDVSAEGDDSAPEDDAPPLAPGTRLDAFEVIGPLGTGGMGQVYRARDTRLDRSVAIKVLPLRLAADPTVNERFEREARAMSRLVHPHVCVLYDIGQARLADGAVRRYLVMELLEGETLAARLTRGAVALDHALDCAIQIVDALVAAHGQGVVHRDLKPANIMLTRDGVKLLDFGVARLDRDSLGRRGGMDGLTGAGRIAGTLPYMAPEQIRGETADVRSDIFAFGAVLYEMLTARRAFAEGSQAGLVAEILERDPPSLASTHPIVPAELRRIVRKTLHKDQDRRYQTAKDLLLDLEALRDDAAGARQARRTRPWARRSALRWSIVAIVALAAVLSRALWWPSRSEPSRGAQRLSAALGIDATLATTDAPVTLSPDGSWLAFVARTPAGEPRLHVRRTDQLDAAPLSGTDGASTPCFSPDGQWVAFFADRKLKKVPVTGGAVVTVADAPAPRGAWWAEDGTIVFAPHNRAGLSRVSSVGGRAAQVTTLAPGEVTHRFPQVLPGGDAILYAASSEVDNSVGSSVVVQRLSTGERIVVHRGGYFGRYVESGHILYMEGDTLFAMPFDGKGLRATGPAGRTAESVEADPSRGAAQLAVSRAGTLAYIRGRNAFGARPMAWLDRAGTLSTLRTRPDDWANPEFSPDGRRIAVDIARDGQRDIWIYEWTRDNLTRLTSEPTNEEFPVWTPDGARIVYRSSTSATHPSGYTIAWQRADGTGVPQALVRAPGALRPGSWHPVKNVLAYSAIRPGTGEDLMILPVDGDEIRGWKPGPPAAIVSSTARERAPTFSPDGRWLSYSSNESGEDQVYVRPFPRPGARVMVSSAGGQMSSWSRTRPEVVFMVPEVDYRFVLMSARYRVRDQVFVADRPRLWAPRSATVLHLLGNRSYALHPDGARMAIAPPAEDDGTARGQLTFVNNLADELRQIAPSTR